MPRHRFLHTLCPAAVALLLSATVSAQSLADRDWTGFYIGGHLGRGSGDADVTARLGGEWSIESQELRDFVARGFSTRLDPDGTSYGVQAGYRFQFDNGIVLGGEADYAQLGLEDRRQSGALSYPASPSLTYDFGNRVEIDSQWSLRAKFGYAFDRHLLFVTAGWTQVDVDASAGVVSSGGYDKLGRASDSLDGSVYGAGYAFSFGNGWSLRAEYLRSDVDDLRFDTAYRPGSTFVDPPYRESLRQTLDFDVFRVGVDYRF
ncbi:outer membrane protein [Pseudoxanthomonas mexicana]